MCKNSGMEKQMMKKILNVSMLLIAMLFTANASACGMGEQMDGYENATVKHAHDHWQAGSNSPIPFLFLDVRTTEEYAEGHVDGSIL
ncbi:MAG TPA: rhodanese-like domain-containing protein, partial [Mariprofundaceae bacterium]|nr:rhodanese-like domain-containing protein [Mariprofundaceae bacterium]